MWILTAADFAACVEYQCKLSSLHWVSKKFFLSSIEK